jgi:hypothetical protein
MVSSAFGGRRVARRFSLLIEREPVPEVVDGPVCQVDRTSPNVSLSPGIPLS